MFSSGGRGINKWKKKKEKENEPWPDLIAKAESRSESRNFFLWRRVLGNTKATLPAVAQWDISSQLTLVPDYFRAVGWFCFFIKLKKKKNNNNNRLLVGTCCFGEFEEIKQVKTHLWDTSQLQEDTSLGFEPTLKSRVGPQDSQGSSVGLWQIYFILRG